MESAVASLAINYAKAINDQGGDSDASFQIVSGLSTVFLGKLITDQNDSYKCFFFDIILKCPFCKNELQNSGTFEHFHHPNMSDWHIRNITLHIISCNAVTNMSFGRWKYSTEKSSRILQLILTKRTL